MSGPAEPRRLTEQQLRPLGVLGSSVALSSGAGCGKTTVLTERFLRELEGPEPRSLRSIVALTFTEKSARELRQRIRRECRAKLAPEADAPAPRWREVLRALEAAPVGTFHEFCGQWLRRHAVEARIDPDFQVLDDSIAGAVREEALARFLRKKLAESDPDLTALAVEFSMRSVRESLAALLRERAADDFLDKTAEELVRLWKSVWEEQERPALFGGVCRVARQSLDLLSSSEFTHPKLIALRGLLLDRLPTIAGLADSDEGLEALRLNAYLPKGLRGEHWPSPELNAAVRQSLETLRKAIEGYREKSLWNAESALLAAEHGLRYARLARDAREEYERAKRARGGLDFDDLIGKTRDLLRASDEATRARLADSIALVLVDEFQDTDPVQSEVLRLLTGAGFANGRLFVVGDSKQSIYRFRGAQPRIFQEFRDAFPDEGHLELSENFRSVPGILDFVNALFQDTFPEARTKLEPGPVTPRDPDQPAVEFLWATEADAETKGRVRDSRALEARWLARHLRRRLDAGWQVRDRVTNEPRPAHAGDIAFLFRALTDVAPYERALYDEGFDYHTTGGSAFYAQQEISDLVNLLTVLEDPFDAVALAGALRSPFFCLSDDGLYWLATARRDLPEGLHAADTIPELSERDRRQALRARTFLERWRGFKDRGPIAGLLDRVLEESGYEAALLGEFLGDRKRANARKLVRMARQFDEQGGFTLADFVARLRAGLRNPPREDQAATADEQGQSVRLMSVHQAKGLEFPIVVLPDLNRVPSGARQGVVLDPTLGPLVRLSQDFQADTSEDGQASGEGLGWRLFSAREQREEDNEASRLFYVATTRARDALVLAAGIGAERTPRSTALKLLDRRFDPATGGCRAELPEDWPMPRVTVITTAPVPSDLMPRPRTKPRLLEIARTIRETPAGAAMVSPARARRPRFIDLDPSATLAPGAARLDRLVRSILAEPEGLDPRTLRAVAERAARKQAPAALASSVNDAVDRLSPWLTGTIHPILVGALEIRRGVLWTLAYPPEGESPTVFQGRTDLLFRDREGHWGLLNVCDAKAPSTRERLRLFLGIRAAELNGRGPVRHAWMIRHGNGGGAEVLDPETIEAALREDLADLVG